MSESAQWANQSVLVTGVAGTIGKEILRQLLELGVARVYGIDINETELFFLAEQYAGDARVRLSLGNVRDKGTLTEKMQGIDIVVHAAALKHVGLCELSPRDAVGTNVDGIINIIDAAVAGKVKRVVNTSSDKAVNPTSVMGVSKLMGERLLSAAQAHYGSSGPIFVSTRFGNVLGSRGSVVPLFERQIAQGGPVSLTDERMTRFIMSLDESVSLVLKAGMMARGGEVFITKMPVIRIADLAAAMIQQRAAKYGHKPENIALRTVGIRVGEKLYEELLSNEEVRRSIEYGDFLIAFSAAQWREGDSPRAHGFDGPFVKKPFISSDERPMTRDGLSKYLAARFPDA
jgi:FlaA1/EpsC-like NDP-sugar epimerase